MVYVTIDPRSVRVFLAVLLVTFVLCGVFTLGAFVGAGVARNMREFKQIPASAAEWEEVEVISHNGYFVVDSRAGVCYISVEVNSDE